MLGWRFQNGHFKETQWIAREHREKMFNALTETIDRDGSNSTKSKRYPSTKNHTKQN